MKQESVKINILFNILRVTMAVIYPIITFPYVARILMSDGVGKVEFARTIISYFIIIAMLGINTYATREVAKLRQDKDKLSKFCHEMIIINICSVIVAYSFFLFFLYFYKSAFNQKSLYLILSIGIILNAAGMEWLYQGLEKYIYITVRTIFFQIISLILLFLFVKNKNDYVSYALLITISSFGSNILNLINSFKYITFKIYKNYNIKKHLSNIVIIFATNLVMSLYGQAVVIILGILGNDANVGVYSTSFKLIQLIISIMISVNIVVFPRLSYYIEIKDNTSLNRILEGGFNILFLIAIPITLGLFLLAKEIILIFAGSGFYESIICLKILSPVIILIALNNFMVYQILMPNNKEKQFLTSIIIGNVANLFIGLSLIFMYKNIGAAITRVIIELVIFIVLYKYSIKLFKLKISLNNFISVGIGTALESLIILTIKNLFSRPIIILVISVFVFFICYLFELIILKNKYALDFIYSITKKIKRTKLSFKI
ncbi:heteropolysaccharide repeat-containing protein [Clostridium polyendosporum]|uniref:Heteropolysaccharide repeat-containing protein n=1 Tax=Clostridium polyendosporum TaxID=69208 RepID=A0A919RX43_9CLOT|nr:flippase [Clostridium polyendosporum]GIM27386.1 heteropolysaccharide repeat-containing protein [Clostridium polyendosporum]